MFRVSVVFCLLLIYGVAWDLFDLDSENYQTMTTMMISLTMTTMMISLTMKLVMSFSMMLLIMMMMEVTIIRE